MRQNITLSLVSVFLTLWLYSEIVQFHDREAHLKRVNEFMASGERFTKQDAAALETEIAQLTDKIDDCYRQITDDPAR